jgi:hypothetical protein
LIFRSGYLLKILGILLAIDGLGWVANSLRPQLYPSAHLGFFLCILFRWNAPSALAPDQRLEDPRSWWRILALTAFRAMAPSFAPRFDKQDRDRIMLCERRWG